MTQRPFQRLTLLMALFLCVVGCSGQSSIQSRPLKNQGPQLSTPGLPGTPPDLGAWINYWNLDAGLKSLERAKGQLRDVFCFAFQLDASGKPVLARPEQAARWETLIRDQRHLGVRVWVTVVNDYPAGEIPSGDQPVGASTAPGSIKKPAVQKGRELIQALLADPARREKHIQQLVDLCRRWKADGLDVDYENLEAQDRDAFSGFIGELSQRLHKAKKLLSVTVQPKGRETRSRGAGAADYAALARHADRLQIMLYNLHNAKTAPGPVATRSWIGEVMDFALTQCEASKLVPILKVSGFQWGARTREVTFQALANPPENPQRHPDGDSPFFESRINGLAHPTHYEDALSLKTKIAFLQKRGFKAVVLWSLGAEDPALWEPLETKDSPKKGQDPSRD